jgi:hypothetical protein
MNGMSNPLAVCSFLAGGLENRMSNILANRLSYLNSTSSLKPQAITIKMPVGSLNMSMKTAQNLLKGLKTAGKAVGLLGTGVTLIEGFSDNNFTWVDGVKVGISLLTTFTPAGWIYGAIDLGFEIFNDGNGLTDMIGTGVDNLIK